MRSQKKFIQSAPIHPINYMKKRCLFSLIAFITNSNSCLVLVSLNFVTKIQTLYAVIVGQYRQKIAQYRYLSL